MDLEQTKSPEREFISGVLFQLVERENRDDIHTFVLSVYNGRKEEIVYGDYYVIETLIGDKWYSFYELQAWEDIAYGVKPNCSSEIVISVVGCPKMVKGTYRIVKDVLVDCDDSYQKGYIAAEFQID